MTTTILSNCRKNATESLSSCKNATFYRLTPSRLKELYTLRLIDTTGYVLLLIKALRKEGWKLTIKLSEFLTEWGLSRSSWYRATAKLKQMKLLNLNCDRVVEVWCDSPVSTVGTAVSTVGTAVSTVGLETMETLPVSGVESSFRSDSDLIRSTTNSEGRSEETLFVDEIKEIEEKPESGQSESSVLDNQEVSKAYERLRSLGVSLNPTIRKFVQTLNAEIVQNAIAHLEERVKAREQFKNINGAVVNAFKNEAKPERLINPPQTHPQPSKEQLQTLERAKREGKVRSYTLAPYRGGQCWLVDCTVRRVVMTWWEWLEGLKPVG